MTALFGYAICSEPRSGTNYLCDLLASTGVLGHPREYFDGPDLRRRYRPDYPEDLEAQFSAILAEGATENGVYGVKMFSAEFDRVAKTRWASRLPNLRFVHFERLDYLGQAISEARAIQTRQYHAATSAAADPVYDARLIRQQLEATARGHARWRLFFARNAISPLRLTYEALLDNPQQAVDRIADFVGSGPATIDPAKVRVEIQRDSISELWRERFLDEEAGLDRLDRFEKDTAWAALRRRIKGR